MHLLVLSAFRLEGSQGLGRGQHENPVSMHLLVFSAFRRLKASEYERLRFLGLNAPSGAQCFPTGICGSLSTRALRLNAPSGAQCFPTFQKIVIDAISAKSQCTFWCSVLSDLSATLSGKPLGRTGLNAPSGAQCFPTSPPTTVTTMENPVSMHLLVLNAFRPSSTSARQPA